MLPLKPLGPWPEVPQTWSASEGSGFVCWSRMQAEAGQMLDAIIARKERERQAGNGLFLWGVGNAPSIAVKPLARLRMPVRVVLSAMKSKPKMVDLKPNRTVVWRRYIDENGIEQQLPPHALVTSRGDSPVGAQTRHHALMCCSDAPLSFQQGIPFDPSAFRNVGGLGSPVGSSQVTALLRQVADPGSVSAYEANIAAWLTEGYWVRLSDPWELSVKSIAQLAEFDGDSGQWLGLVERLRGRKTSRTKTAKPEALLI